MSNEASPADLPDSMSRFAGAPLRRPVFVASFVGVIAMTVWALLAPRSAEAALAAATAWVTGTFGWFYILIGTVVVAFVLYLGLSRYGRVRLGPDHSTPQFSTLSWACMLFAAGIGTDIMFYAVLGPASHYFAPPIGTPESIGAAREATVWTIFHYGVNGWGMYGLMGLAMSYFSYRAGLPLAVRSALAPIFGRRVDGPIGHAVDTAAVLGTVFGVATSLGIGVVFLNVGLNIVFGIQIGLVAQSALIVVAVIITAISATTGVEKGIRFLSTLCVVLAMVLAVFVLATGRTSFILNATVTNVGDFVNSFLEKTLETFAYEGNTEWMNLWTLFFWAWWIAWASFVGLFLARISRGRTIRQFVLGTLIIPFCFVVMWVSIFGNEALARIRDGDAAFGEAAQDFSGIGFYRLLEGLPVPKVTILVAVLVGLLLYVTSADSGALVTANLCSRLRSVSDDGPAWQRITWATVIGVLTIAMLLVGGITALQYATIIFGLPFAFALVLVMWGLLRALRVEVRRDESRTHIIQGMFSGRDGAFNDPTPAASWKARLARATSFVDDTAAQRYLRSTVQPALQEVADELGRHGVEAVVTSTGGERGAVTLSTDSPVADPFVYRVEISDSPVPTYGGRMIQARDHYARLEVHLASGGQGYDVMGYSQPQIIHDCLDQYEQHLEFLRLAQETRT